MSVDLFELLPAVYRLRDAQLAQTQPLLMPAEVAEVAALQLIPPPLPADKQARLDELTAKALRGPLQSLLMLVGEQIAAVAYDIDQLYDDQFIETCASWVIPYIGDLIGYQAIRGIAPAVDNPRAEVAETISLRRRKGTVLVMEQLARDVTAWGAHAVEMFRVLGDTQYLNHIRPKNFYAPDLRRWENGLYVDAGFDQTSHRVDVRSIGARRGRYNIPNIGIFLWSLNAYSITNAQPTPAAGAASCYRFSSLGMDIPLFHRALSQGEPITTPAQPVNVPDRLRRRVLCADIAKGVGAQFYGPNNSLTVLLDGQLLNPYQIQIADLSGADGSWSNLPPANSDYLAVVDPELGRIALPASAPGSHAPTPTVSYYYGFNASMGGGEYARAAAFIVDDPAWVVPYPDTATVPRYTSLKGALDFAISQLALNGQVAVEISGSDTHPVPSGLVIDLPAGTTLELRAADHARPTLLLDGEFIVRGSALSTLIVNGLLIGAGTGMSPGAPSPAALVHLPANSSTGAANLLQQLELTDCTLVPGWAVDANGVPRDPTSATLVVEPETVKIVGTRSILGSIRSAQLATVELHDSIVDATDRTHVAYSGLDGTSGGAALTLIGCTVVGKVHATLLTLVSDTIFWSARVNPTDSWVSALIADRKQEGCVRFSFLPAGAVIPRHFKCVEQALASVQPLFFSLRYGTPAYMKLLASTDDAIRRGASDGGEMGAYHWLLAPQRESDINIRLREYLPVGLEFGLIYET